MSKIGYGSQNIESTFPDKLLLSSISSWRLDIFAISVGIVPLSWLLSRYSNPRFVNSPNSEGIVPLSLF